MELKTEKRHGGILVVHVQVDRLNAGNSQDFQQTMMSLMDERYRVAISRLGVRVRVAGSAEIGGAPETRRESSIQTLYKVLHDWFPGSAQHSQLGASVQVWKGARPMLPDGPPVIGPSGLPGLWLNLGHGSSGWALSCGSARALADLMAGRAADIDMEGLDVGRLSRLR